MFLGFFFQKIVSEKNVPKLRCFYVFLNSWAPMGARRMGHSPIPMEYGQPLFVWLSRDLPSVRTYASTNCTGGVGETIKRKGEVSQACLVKSTFLI